VSINYVDQANALTTTLRHIISHHIIAMVPPSIAQRRHTKQNKS